MVVNSAAFSPCRTYRYSVVRRLDLLNEDYCVFIGLNPSTADEQTDDPTIRRCMGYARAWGYGWLIMLNLFAYRATDPNVMKAAADPVGPDNDTFLRSHMAGAGIVVAAWGNHGSYLGRDVAVRAMLPNLHFLRMTRDGSPGHPLYLPASLKPQKWER
jgi:hypothetical protein